MLRSHLLACLLGAACVLIACGSSSSDDVFDGKTPASSSETADGSTNAATQDASAATDSAPASEQQDASAALDTGGGQPADTGPSCQALMNDVEAKRKEAIVCSPLSLDPQCGEAVDGICCKLWVTDADAKASKDFKAAVAAYKNAGCATNCGSVKCADGPTYMCQAVSGSRGACSQK